MVDLINTALMRTAMAMGRLRQRLTEERGQDLMEYAMLSGLVALVIAGVGAAIFTGAVNNMITGVANCIDFTNGIACGSLGP